MPAAMAAWRAGFWPVPAVRIWPRMTSVTWPGSTLARFSAPVMATCPRKEAATPLKAPLNAPIGVRGGPQLLRSGQRTRQRQRGRRRHDAVVVGDDHEARQRQVARPHELAGHAP